MPAESAIPPVTPGARDHVVSVRLTAEESAYLDQLTEVHVTDRSSLLRHLILSAPLWRLTPVEPVAKPKCLCDLIDTSTIFGPPSYTRGQSNGCLIHPASEYERKTIEAQRLREAEFEAADAEARRKAREA